MIVVQRGGLFAASKIIPPSTRHLACLIISSVGCVAPCDFFGCPCLPLNPSLCTNHMEFVYSFIPKYKYFLSFLWRLRRLKLNGIWLLLVEMQKYMEKWLYFGTKFNVLSLPMSPSSPCKFYGKCLLTKLSSNWITVSFFFFWLPEKIETEERSFQYWKVICIHKKKRKGVVLHYADWHFSWETITTCFWRLLIFPSI